jgi:glucokinase
MTNHGLLLGLDFGGTKLAAGIAYPGGSELLAYQRQPTPASGTPEIVLPVVQELVDELLSEQNASILAIGASFGGPLLKPGSGKIQCCPHLPGWEEYPLQMWLENTYGVKATIENDANAAAVGEWRYGAGRGKSHILYVTVSTGIGSGLILNGKLHHGHDGLAGELGHTILVPDGPVCTCGRRGCLEALAAGPAIARRAIKALNDNPEAGQLLRALCENCIESVTALEVSQASSEGDELALEVLSAAATDLGRGIANAVNLVNPDRVILGGGVVKSGEAYLQTVRTSASDHVLDGITLDIVRAEHDDLAPLRGAIALAEASVAASDE